MRLVLGSAEEPAREGRLRLFPVQAIGSAGAHSSRSIARRNFCVGFVLACLAGRLSAQKTPLRIVSTAPSVTESLFALGLGGRVVGVSQFCDFPPEVRKLPRVGSYVNPDVEAIARLAPDLVILQRSSSSLTGRLAALQIPFLEVPIESLDDVYTGIRRIAAATGVPARGAALVGQIQNSLAAIRARAAALPMPRVLVVVDRRQGTLSGLIATGPANYVNQLIGIAGGINVLDKPGLPHYPQISLETVLREDPGVILDISGTQESPGDQQRSQAATLALWRRHGELTAVRTGQVFAGTSNDLVVPGPRTVVAAEKLFEYFHRGRRQG